MKDKLVRKDTLISLTAVTSLFIFLDSKIGQKNNLKTFIKGVDFYNTK